MNWLISQNWFIALPTALSVGTVLIIAESSRRRARRLEHYLSQILRTRYTHPEELAEALSDAERAFPYLAPGGFMTITDNAGDVLLRRDVLKPERPVVPNPGETYAQASRRQRAQEVFGGYQPFGDAKMPPPPAADPEAKFATGGLVKPAPDHDGKTLESCKLRFGNGSQSFVHPSALDRFSEGQIEGLVRATRVDVNLHSDKLELSPELAGEIERRIRAAFERNRGSPT